jgi:hypothetical protein
METDGENKPRRLPHAKIKIMSWPNHSLEPAPVGLSFVVDITHPAWLSFGR